MFNGHCLICPQHESSRDLVSVFCHPMYNFGIQLEKFCTFFFFVSLSFDMSPILVAFFLLSSGDFSIMREKEKRKRERERERR